MWRARRPQPHPAPPTPPVRKPSLICSYISTWHFRKK
jgi:hypothetical protein